MTFCRGFLNCLIVVLITASALIMVGCPGTGSNSSSSLGGGWTISGPDMVTHSSPSNRIITLTLKSNGTERYVEVTALDIPTGWTVSLPTTPIHLDPPAIAQVNVQAQVTIPDGLVVDSSQRLRFKATETSGANAGESTYISVLVNIGADITEIRESIPYAASNKVYESMLEISWGQPTPWGTLMSVKDMDFTLPGFNTVGDAIIWFTPKSGGLSLDPGDVDTVTIKVLPATNRTARTFHLTPYFDHTSGQYGVPQSFSSEAAFVSAYEIKSIDYQLGVLTTDPDTATSYTVEFSSLLPGRYTFATQNLPGRFQATVTPTTVDISTGDSATVRVDITRTSSGTFEDTEEFILRMTHSSDATYNSSIKFPIQSWLGR